MYKPPRNPKKIEFNNAKFREIHGLAEPIITDEQRLKKMQKLAEKEENKPVLAYYIKERHSKHIRNVPVSCPKRLLETVQKLGQEKHEKNYVPAPTAKKEVKDESNGNETNPS